MRSAFAHDTGHAVHDAWSAWVLDPFVLVPLALAAWLYWRGVRSSWRRAGAGRGVKRWEALCFAGGMGGLALALVWPLDALGERLFSAHMAQHLVLMNLAAPLLVLGAPLQAMIRALPLAARRAAAALVQSGAWRAGWRWISGAAAATLLHQAVLWAWHTPRGVAAALQDDALHIAMHASLLAAALVFWTAVLRPRDGQYWRSIVALLATLKVSGLISIVMLIRPSALYVAYGDMAAAWGLAPVQDEQLGWGLMMSIGTLTYLAAAVALFAASFARLESSRHAA